MITDDKIEELCADAAEVYTLNMGMYDFISLMQEKHQHANEYVLKVIFNAIFAHSDLIKETAQ